MVQSEKETIDWSLTNLDTGVIFRGQFNLDDVSEVSGGVVSEQNRYGKQDAVTQWTNGKPTGYSFSTLFYSRHSEEDAYSLFETLKSFSQKDPNLGRAPICRFVFGRFIRDQVYVEDASPTYSDVTADGTPRRIEVSVSLKRYIPFTSLNVDPNRPGGNTLYKVVSDAERSYEAIAKRFYGDPLLGDRLRKRHPDAPMAPVDGQIVEIPLRSVILQETVEPSCHVFDLEDEDAAAAFKRVLDDRAQRRVVIHK